MGDVADKFKSAFRDYVTEGVPPSGAHKPDKSELQALGEAIEGAMTGVTSEAQDAAERAELARDTAFQQAGFYASTAAGIAATTSGQEFNVAASDGLSATRYRNNSGVADPVFKFSSKAAVDAVVGASDELASTSGRTLAISDGSAIGSAAMAVQTDGISLSNTSSSKMMVMSSPLSLPAGRSARFTVRFRPTITSGTATVLVGFGSSGARFFVAFRSNGTIFVSNNAYATVTVLATTAASSIYATGQECSASFTWDGSGVLKVSFTTPNGTSPTYTLPQTIAAGAIWYGAAVVGSTRFLSSVNLEAVQPLVQELLSGSDASTTLPIASPLVPLLDVIRLGRADTPGAPQVFNRRWAFNYLTPAPWRLKLSVIGLGAAAEVRFKRFDSTGTQIGADIIVQGNSGPNPFSPETHPVLIDFAGNAGEYIGFYSSQAGVASGQTADGLGWFSATGNGSTINVSADPTTSERLDAYIEIELAYSTPARLKSAQLGNARQIVLPSEFGWCGVQFGLKPDGTIAHDYNPYDVIPITSPSEAGERPFVDEVNGDDVSGTGARSAPFKSLLRALHNSTSQGSIWVYLLSDLTFEGSGIGANLTARNIVIMPYGEEHVTISARFGELDWTLVSGTESTYETMCPDTPQEVWDEADQTEDGLARSLVGSGATGELPAGSRQFSGNTVRIRTFDSRPPDNDIKVMGNGNHFAITASSGTDRTNLWIDRVWIEGGSAIWATNTGYQSKVWLSNLKMRYGTNANDMFHNYGRVDSIAYRVEAEDTLADGFGYSGPRARGIEIDCGSLLTGARSLDPAGNGSTAHGSPVIRAHTGAGFGYLKSSARAIHDVEGSTILLLGIRSGQSLATDPYEGAAIVAGNPISPDATKTYILGVSIAPESVSALATNAESEFFVHSISRNGVPDYSAPVINEWWAF